MAKRINYRNSYSTKNGLTTSLLFFFFLKMAKNWVGRTTLNGEKNRMASTKKKRKKDKHSGETKFQ